MSLPCGDTPEVPTPDVRPVRRSLLDASVQIVDGNPVVTLACDCGAVTDVTVVVDGAPPADGQAHGTELAVTCEGCGTAHWFTIALQRAEPSTGVEAS